MVRVMGSPKSIAKLDVAIGGFMDEKYPDNPKIESGKDCLT